MRAAVLFSGGKDSTIALQYAIEQEWEIEALISVKPKDTEAYLWHYSTVEWTLLQAEASGTPLILIKTEKVGPKEEAKELEKVFKKLKIDALVIGGVGLQKTQIREVENVAKKFDIDIIIPYQKYTSEELLREELKSGLDIRITNVAVEGLGKEWLGRKLDENSLNELIGLSKKFGFDPLGEGGHYDSFVLDAPIFKKRIEFVKTEKIWDNKTSSGYLEVKEAVLIPK